MDEASPRTAPHLVSGVTPQASVLLSRNSRYRKATTGFCSKKPSLQGVGTKADLTINAAKAKREARILKTIQRELVRLRVLHAERGNLKSYLTALESELALDASIEAEVKAGDEADALAALSQHTDNSRARSELARRLGIRCLIQTDSQ